jgi:Fe-S-cluster containining protein
LTDSQESTMDNGLEAVLDLIAEKRKKHGRKYECFISAVAEVLRTEFPEAFGKMPEERLAELISFVDVVGEDSQGMMKRLKEACAGCGWCCSQTVGIIVSPEDAERISRQLKRKKEELFTVKDGVWMIKNAHPCQWWNQANGRCQIYNIRPQTCRTWPTLPNEKGQSCLQPVAECAYAVRVTAVKVLDSLKARQKAG